MITEEVDEKATLRAWLLRVLAELEIMPGVEAKRVEDSSGNHICLDIHFKT